MNDKDLKEYILEYGKGLGFPIIRITSAEPFRLWEDEVKRRKRLDPDTANSWAQRKLTSDPKELLLGARSVVVAVYPYTPFIIEEKGETGTYSAHYQAYPKGREAARKLAEVFETRGYKALADPPLPAKLAAVRAGAGYFGKNGVIHTPGYGSWITLHLILTDAKLPLDDPMLRLSDCGSCKKCIEACPTGAIGERGAVILSRCLRYHMNGSGFIPLDMREKMGTSILGCDACQINCPRNAASKNNWAAPLAEDLEPFDLKAVLTEWKDGLKDRMKRAGDRIGQNYARPRRILSMAVIAAGNTGNPRYIPLLAESLNHPHPPIRGHSAWALGRLKGSEAETALRDALKKETDSRVIEEINQALAAMERDRKF